MKELFGRIFIVFERATASINHVGIVRDMSVWALRGRVLTLTKILASRKETRF